MQLGEVIRVERPAFYVIGKEGKGLAEEGASWVPALWELATKDFEEIEFLVRALARNRSLLGRRSSPDRKFSSCRLGPLGNARNDLSRCKNG